MVMPSAALLFVGLLGVSLFLCAFVTSLMYRHVPSALFALACAVCLAAYLNSLVPVEVAQSRECLYLSAVECFR